jgi:hypothetical protein
VSINSKYIDYKILDAVGKPDHADESGLMPIRTRRLKAEDTNTTQEKDLYNGKQMDTFSKRNYITMKMLTNIFQIHSTM